jgi:hypothetical protein
LRRNAMIPGEYQNFDTLQPRRAAALPTAKPLDESLKAAETSRRLGQLAFPPCDRLRCRRIPAGQIQTTGAQLCNRLERSHCQL